MVFYHSDIVPNLQTILPDVFLSMLVLILAALQEYAHAKSHNHECQQQLYYLGIIHE
jgi:hypothetical protein